MDLAIHERDRPPAELLDELLTGVLKELQQRHDLDTAQVDDVVMGCVSPVGEQGSCIAKTAALKAGWDFRAAGVPEARGVTFTQASKQEMAQLLRQRLQQVAHGRRSLGHLVGRWSAPAFGEVLVDCQLDLRIEIHWFL